MVLYKRFFLSLFNYNSAKLFCERGLLLHIPLIVQLCLKRMSKGGCIVFDDYDEKRWPGATKAVDEFLLDKPEKIKFSEEIKPGLVYYQSS